MASHGFTSVDAQPDPAAWIDVLDRVRAEPFYRAYKHRVAELLRPRRGGRYLDVGAGTGDDARALARRFDVEVTAVDASETMVIEARRRGLTDVHLADAAALPFAAESFDGASADRTLQHVPDLDAAVAELARVTKRGGRVVAADPDYGTQAVAIDDDALAARVLGWRAERALRNGTAAHRLGRRFHEAGVRELEIEARTLVVRDPTAVDNVMGLRGWARIAAAAGELDARDVEPWETALDAAVAAGTFLYAVTFFLTAGTRR